MEAQQSLSFRGKGGAGEQSTAKEGELQVKRQKPLKKWKCLRKTEGGGEMQLKRERVQHKASS